MHRFYSHQTYYVKYKISEIRSHIENLLRYVQVYTTREDLFSSLQPISIKGNVASL